MRLVAVALVLALAAATAGCIQVQVGAPQPTATATSSSASHSTSSKPGALKADFTWSPQTPRVGQSVAFQPKADGLAGHKVDAWSWEFGDNGTSRDPSPSHVFRKAGESVVTLRLMTDDGRVAQAVHGVFVLNTGKAPAPGPAAGNQTGNATEEPAPVPGVFGCDGATVVEPNDTFGRDDGGLAWAALKTGFRVAVVWATESATTETLRYSVAGSATLAKTATESVPTSLHLFVLDGLPEGNYLCFTAGSHPQHAVRLANAMKAFQPAGPGDAHGTYVANYLVLNNEGGDLTEVTDGLARYADLLWDATDGWVRAGALLAVSGDYLHHNSGWASCYATGFTSPLCNRLFDVIVTEDAFAEGAASTYRKGVTDPDVAIWMNTHWQAVPGPVSNDDFGAVLVHESGHYLFDMDDLYGDPVAPDAQDCDVPELSMSIMGGGRDTTEYDDALHPCPHQPGGYVPSWTLMRGQFPEVPERDAIDEGPSGNGGVAFVQAYVGP